MRAVPLLEDDEDVRTLFRVTPRERAYPEVGRVSYADLSGPSDEPRVLIYTDGGCRGNPGQAGFGAVIHHGGRVIELMGTVARATNNESEYEGLLLALRWAIEQQARRLLIRMDSQLVVYQMQGRFGVSQKLKPLYLNACALVLDLGDVLFEHVPRAQNKHADMLATRAMDNAGFPRQRRGVWLPPVTRPKP